MSSQSINAPSSQLAVASLVLGLLSWVLIPVLGGFGAVICGHMARRDIRAARGALGGDGMAVAGLVLGYLHLVVLIVGVIIALVFFGGLLAMLAHFAH
ncbi:DUF4190 domain-containing protein [Lysobacter sp. HA18]